MPEEVFDVEKFVEFSSRASECRVKRLGEVTKLKLRTKRRLYTIKLPAEEAEELLKKIKCKIIEV
ncbi:50S ribosomal protein L38e [Candidatus Bathyarchaeota archaeon]|nr:50S ribosomal protein L38e [Candidatus Bathyarchaeota archaeon]